MNLFDIYFELSDLNDIQLKSIKKMIYNLYLSDQFII